jgi:hypothetical protein
MSFDLFEAIAVIGVTLLVGFSMVFQWNRLRQGREVGLRPLPAYRTLRTQVGRAIESGRHVHITLGRAGLHSPAGPTSVAALTALDHLAVDSCASGIPPMVTLGEATLLPAAQDSLRQGFAQAGRLSAYSPIQTQFIAPETQPMAYAAGVSNELHAGNVGSNLMIGRFGPEIAIMGEAAARANAPQVIGSDDPTALALASVLTRDLLIGEELLAAGAYLQGKPWQIASLRSQDVLRWLIMGLIFVFAVLKGIGFFG